MSVGTLAVFAFVGPVLPLVTDTVRVAEAVRRALMSRFDAWGRRHPAAAVAHRRPGPAGRYASAAFAGKDAAGRPLAGHRHAYFLPTADDPADGRRLTHVTVVAGGGFGPGDVAALTGLRHVAAGDRRWAVRLVGLGSADAAGRPLVGPAWRWVSATPFVGPAHVGRVGRGRAMRKAVRAEVRHLADRGLLPADAGPAAVVELPAASADRGGLPSAVAYHRGRSRGGDAGFGRPFGLFELTFASAVRGPIALGYGSHFGLGLFVSADGGGSASS